jgi:hypothetical protein
MPALAIWIRTFQENKGNPNTVDWTLQPDESTFYQTNHAQPRTNDQHPKIGNGRNNSVITGVG